MSEGADLPVAGQVFDYHYLWKWRAERGETEPEVASKLRRRRCRQQ